MESIDYAWWPKEKSSANEPQVATMIECPFELPPCVTPPELIEMGLCAESDPRLRPGFVGRLAE